MNTQDTLITDDQTLVSAKTRFGYAIKVFDNGFGDLYINRDSMGITGISRSQTWEEAYETYEDEFAMRATIEEVLEDFPEFEKEGFEGTHEDACFQESYGWSGNNGLFHKDLNGDSCDLLTPELIEALEITLVIEDID